VEAVQSAKTSLTVAIASASPLPPKERIASNQHSWTKTSERMGVKKHHRLPEEVRPTAEAIGTAKGKRRLVYTNPYAGGKRPGRLAKPDAVSAVANQKVRFCAAPLAHTLPPTLAASFPPTSQPILGPTFHTLPLVLAPATQTAHNYMFLPALTSVFPPTTAF